MALGPLLVLVPGPALLNGLFDMAALRLLLGIARVGYSLLVILTITTGVLLGLGLGGATLPATVTSPPAPWWLDALLAGLAAAAYCVFFNLPWRLLPYPVLGGMLAHITRWVVLGPLAGSNALGAGAACLVAATVLGPLARRHQLPFAGVGFAAVVALVPGIFLFRLGGGLVQAVQTGAATPPALLAGLLADATTALLTLVAMGLGLLLPQRLHVHWWRRQQGAPRARGTST